MSKRYDLDPSDADRHLAAQLGAGLPEQSEDSLLRAASSWRDEYQADAPQANSERMWGTINAATARNARPAPARAWFRRPVWRAAFAVASVLFVVISLSILPTDSPVELLAEATAESQIWVAEDGSMVTLRPYSRLLTDPDVPHVYTLQGEAVFEVTRDPSRVFAVESGAARVEVLGTTFSVVETHQGTEVNLIEGRVRVTHLMSDAELILAPGEGTLVSDVGIGGLSTILPEEVLDWTRGEVSYSSRSASAVASEISRHFGVDIALPDGVADERISGRILLRDLDGVLSDLGLVLGGSFRAEAEKRYRFE